MSFLRYRLWLAIALGILVVGLGGGSPLARAQDDSTVSFAELMNRPVRVPVVAAGDACPHSPTGPIAVERRGSSLGSGPVFLTLGQGGVAEVHSFDLHDGVYAMRVILAIAPDIRSPVLVRGQQINGPNRVQFADEGAPTLDALRFGPAPDVPPDDADAGWRFAASSLGVAGPGCYALQADGPYFSETIIFEVSTA